MLSDADIRQIHSQLAEYHSQYLQQHSVKLPSLRNKEGNYTKDALVLVYLAQGYPQTKPVSKKELTPLALCQHLVQLATVPQAIVLDPFAGTGTTCLAARSLDRHFIGIEIQEEYVNIALRRLESCSNPLPGF